MSSPSSWAGAVVAVVRAGADDAGAVRGGGVCAAAVAHTRVAATPKELDRVGLTGHARYRLAVPGDKGALRARGRRRTTGRAMKLPIDFVPPAVTLDPVRFVPVIALPEGYDVYDFTAGYDPDRPRGLWGVGRYDERRRDMYTAALFAGESPRDVHVGVDIAAPVGEPVRAFSGGWVEHRGYNPAAGDYGYVVVTGHTVAEGVTLWALHGHLGAATMGLRAPGERFAAGDTLGYVGDRHENGGWNPHLHFQLSWLRPDTHDLPGAVTVADRAAALRVFPDPRRVLGPLYPGDGAFGL